MNIVVFFFSIFSNIFQVFQVILEKCSISYHFDDNNITEYFQRVLGNLFQFNNSPISDHTFQKGDKKIKIGLLTNEIPPIIYGGVSTWIVNFINMFKNNNYFEVVPIFLAHLDSLPDECYDKYKNIRVINNHNDIQHTFHDIDICINNLWIAEDTLHSIKYLFPSLKIITVCHSLIRMENITNLGSCYTNNFNKQETTFMDSDCVVLISKAEEQYYKLLGYGSFNTQTKVIYNSYSPRFDKCFEEGSTIDVNYNLDNPGYIGRHVPRKRPELPLRAINILNNENVTVFNMGVDYDKYDNKYWRDLEEVYKDKLVIIPFSSNKEDKEYYWKNIGINCITGIYEPFGYTICESIDKGMPVVVSNIDGPKEIINDVKEYVYTYEVDVDDYSNDIINISKAIQKVWDTPSSVRKNNAIMARKCLDKLRPESIVHEWENLIYEII
tara:strand:- start:344 stop:1663 length:1320 start_codon:yes stop_codon:yes gene_type:complete